MSQLILVTGANGALGQVFLKRLSQEKENRCIGLTRATDFFRSPDVTYITELDLLEKLKVQNTIQEISLLGVDSVVFIHPVGKFKFEELGKPEIDEDKDGIDDEVFHSNVTSFLNVLEPLLERFQIEFKKNHPISLTLVGFGSITDKYNILYWQSYTKSKNILRDLMRRMVREDQGNLLKGIFVNVSTTDTGNENTLRPHADKEYWLKPDEIVATVNTLLGEGTLKWEEVDIFKSNPTFNEQEYKDAKKLLQRWRKEMGMISSGR